MHYTKDTYYLHLKELLPESDFTLDLFTGTEQPCEITCNICNRHYRFSYAALVARRARRDCKNVCKYCEKNQWTKRQNDAKNKALYLLEKKKTIKLISDLTTWGARQPATWLCTKCNHSFERSPQVMFAQHGLFCPWCETHPMEYSEDMILAKSQELWGSEYTVLDTTTLKNPNGSKRIIVEHNKCGFKYNVNLWNFLHGQGCPHCRASHGEKKVRDYLIAHNFVFQEQYVVPVNNSYLRFDFYLEENQHKFVIEYNGIQHYQPVEFFNGQLGFEKQQMRDQLKIQYCKENNINLIIIPYTDESIINSEQLAQRLRS